MALVLAASGVAVTARYQRQLSRSLRSQLAKLAGGDQDVLVQSVELLDHETRGGVTFFRIRVTGGEAEPRQWEVLRRYDDFFRLREQLQVRRRRVGSAFPGKTWTSCTGKRLVQRQGLLQAWLEGLLAEFLTGGDARHALIPRRRAEKLRAVHGFLGIAPGGQPHESARPAARSGRGANEACDDYGFLPLSSQALYHGVPAPAYEGAPDVKEDAVEWQTRRKDDLGKDTVASQALCMAC